jgi:SAM-dependent methyltransferase
VRLPQQLRCAAWLVRPGRTGPLSANWGREWGLPIDRFYIERFLVQHADDIRGHVLEVKDDGYTRGFGTAVASSSVLDVDPANADATLVADLQDPASLPGDAFDCVLLTQTLQFVYDLPAAMRSLHRLLRPGGVCLATVPVVSKRDRGGGPYDYWRLLPEGLGRLLGDVFGHESVAVTGYGNTRTAVGFLLGLAAEDFNADELDACDPDFAVVAGARAVKSLRG